MKLLYTAILLIAMMNDVDAAIPNQAIRTTDVNDICTTLTSTVRNVSQSLKKTIFLRDGGDLRRTHLYEVDHRIALSSGGSNDITNLKLQTYSGSCNALDKDKLEVKVHSLICKKQLAVVIAQDILYNHWEEGYKTYIDPNGCK
jgi:hypothetical protein